MIISKSRLKNVVIVGCIVLASVCGFVFGQHVTSVKYIGYLNKFKPIRKGGDLFKYINPLVGVDSPNSFELGFNLDVRKDLLDIVDVYQKKGLKNYAIYYRDLNSSVWFGLNEDEEFFPASLLKTTIALSAFKYAEKDANYLNGKVVFTQQIKDMSLSRKNEDTSLVVGNSYSVHDLISTMLVNSDNSARDLIISSLPDSYMDELYHYLNITEPTAQTNFRMSTENYALFFRLLYSSTFIDEDHSEEMLGILTKTVFPYGLTRDLPSDIPVAHKYGVFNLPKDENGVEMQQLHDCGIIYQLDNPYILCVMTQGKDQSVLADFIASISKRIYTLSLTQ
jgi:beta-lactamase class A